MSERYRDDGHNYDADGHRTDGPPERRHSEVGTGLANCLEQMEERLCRRLENVHEKVKEVNTHLTGGMDPSRGLIVRVDRLEQSEARRVWFTRSSVMVSMTALWAAVMAWYRSR